MQLVSSDSKHLSEGDDVNQNNGLEHTLLPECANFFIYICVQNWLNFSQQRLYQWYIFTFAEFAPNLYYRMVLMVTLHVLKNCILIRFYKHMTYWCAVTLKVILLILWWCWLHSFSVENIYSFVIVDLSHSKIAKVLCSSLRCLLQQKMCGCHSIRME